MHVVQTAADPPNQGRISFEASGCTRNNRQALASIVLPKKTGTGTVARLASAALVDLLSVAKLDTRKRDSSQRPGLPRRYHMVSEA
jgi:hypothetical protein